MSGNATTMIVKIKSHLYILRESLQSDSGGVVAVINCRMKRTSMMNIQHGGLFLCIALLSLLILVKDAHALIDASSTLSRHLPFHINATVVENWPSIQARGRQEMLQSSFLSDKMEHILSRMEDTIESIKSLKGHLPYTNRNVTKMENLLEKVKQRASNGRRKLQDVGATERTSAVRYDMDIYIYIYRGANRHT